MTAPPSDSGPPGLRLESYQPPPDLYDEMLDPARQPRRHWTALLRTFEQLQREGAISRQDNIRRVLREHDATYSSPDDAQKTQRSSPLDLVPLPIPAAEWQALERGLVQRTELLNAILGDIYGPRELLRQGLLPPGVVTGNPGFIRPCAGLRVSGNTFLFLHAVELGRAPDGRWWVLSDATQAPAGAGLALQNRIVLSRVLAEEFRQCRVQRLAAFFQDARDFLRGLAPQSREYPNVVFLSPGPHSQTYFEQVFLARYLGFPLVEGGDLTVRDRAVYIKTLEGLQRVDVLLRRVHDSYCDPLELRADSVLGTPGLVEAARAGNVSVANALGSGVVETPAMIPFLPGICRHLRGEDLALPQVATWWCGQPDALEFARSHLDRLVLRSAYHLNAEELIFGSQQSPAGLARMRNVLERHPEHYVAQEPVTLSSAPVWVDGSLEPQRLLLRVFVCATPQGYRVMPGALARFARSPDALASWTALGDGTKDTWVLTDGPVSQVSLIRTPPRVVRQSVADEVPSRVAENLFWFGRYAERLEDTVRILRCVLNRLTGEMESEEARGTSALIGLLVNLDLFPPGSRDRGVAAMAEREIYRLIYQAHRLGTVRELIARLRQIAFVLRERFSADTWSILSKLQFDASARPARVSPAETLVLLNTLVLDLAAFSGMEMENMTRGHGWRFLDVGRRLERGINIITLLQAGLTVTPRDEAVLEAVLEIADSTMTYRRRYFAQPQWAATLDLLAADDTNPRALAFQVQALADHAQHLPPVPFSGEQRTPSRRLEELRSLFQVLTTDLEAISQDRESPEKICDLLALFGGELRDLSDTIAHQYFSHAETHAQ